jgi:hypothetical protein
MIVAQFEKRMPQLESYQAGRQNIKQREQGVAPNGGEIEREDRGADRALRLVEDFLAGILSLWIFLTILGVIGLNNIGQQVISSLSLKIVAASSVALMVCIISAPLFVPWFVVFVSAYLLVPRKSFLWNCWPCTLMGSLVGIVALWIDALLYTLLGPGSSISLNIPLLTLASVPAAVLGGTICFAAAVTENAAKRKKERAAR